MADLIGLQQIIADILYKRLRYESSLMYDECVELAKEIVAAVNEEENGE